ncbi:MFS transporter [Jeotgalibacillus haloalkalitolerans]|uniref:MFS transporter n=1 Tax=Jeotgalibacillus haloalkalitolerans TaxID=3104292 RepID=A0ABU5KPH6_9BACL|nr:MFS transporter [Jeotgalibacillus sp. HH7-29]MDZ5712605.1 MFS transporter [Jeotgalibacillus sp. HH7-29]
MRRKKSSKENIILIALITGICLMTDSMLYIALPLYWREVGLTSLAEVGILLSVNRLIRIPLNPLAALLTRNLSIRSALLLAISVTTFVNVGFFYLDGFLFWFILRCIWGFIWAILRISGQLLVVHLSSDSDKGTLMGVYNGTYRLGSLIGMGAGGLLCFEVGLKTTSLIFACVCLLAIPFVFLLSYTSFAEKQDARKEKFSLLRNPGVQVTLIRGFSVSFLLQGVFASTVSYYMAKHYGLFLNVNGMEFSAGVAAGLLLGLRWAWEPLLAPKIGEMSDGKRGRHSILLFALLITAGLYPFIDSQLPFFIWGFFIVVILICSTVITTLTDTLFSDEISTHPSKAPMVTCYSIAVDLGAALGPLLAFQFISEGKHFLLFCAGLALCLAWMSYKQNIKQNTGSAVTT